MTEDIEGTMCLGMMMKRQGSCWTWRYEWPLTTSDYIVQMGPKTLELRWPGWDELKPLKFDAIRLHILDWQQVVLCSLHLLKPNYMSKWRLLNRHYTSLYSLEWLKKTFSSEQTSKLTMNNVCAWLTIATFRHYEVWGVGKYKMLHKPDD